MAIKAKIRSNSNIRGKTKPGNQITAQTLKTGNIALSDLTDVNAQGQTDGAMLIYDGLNQTYNVTPQLENENLIISGGIY
ncbi:MAG: hypothetical protein EBY41_05415 [Proteobacteria bacterium]|jgi:hypothetical protein|nr:hypothetical protein [Pseudomonadota bacterium]